MNWNQESVDQVVSILGTYGSLSSSALEEIGEALGEKVSYSSLRHALKRFGYGPPQTHLNMQRMVKSVAKDVEVMTRARSKGGLGRTIQSALTHIEDRYGIPLDDIDPELASAIRDATMEIIDTNSRRSSLLREARSRTSMENRLTALTKSFLSRVGHLKTEFEPLVLQATPQGHVRHLLACLADLHIGRVYINKHGIVEYDKDIAIQRVAEIVAEIAKAAGGVADITLWVAGDIFEAVLGNMRKNQQAKMDLIGKDAYVLARDLITSAVQELSQRTTGKVQLLMTGGNHDRLTEEREYDSEDFMIYMLSDAIASRVPDVEVVVLPPVASVVIGDIEYLLLHGHRNKLRNETDIRRMIENHSLTSLRKIVLQGHYHSFKAISSGKWDCITLPSICGNDDYAQYDINQGASARWVYFETRDHYPRMVGPQFFST